jgi:thioesterase domain-containing protein
MPDSGADATPFVMTPEVFNSVAIGQMLPRADQMGIRLVEMRRGHVEATVPMDGNGNHLGTMYAGVLFAVAEILGGAIVASTFDVRKVYPTIKALTINFRRPARDAVIATASLDDAEIERLEAEAESAGKAQFVLTAQLHDSAGELVAETEGTYQIRNHGT